MGGISRHDNVEIYAGSGVSIELVGFENQILGKFIQDDQFIFKDKFRLPVSLESMFSLLQDVLPAQPNRQNIIAICFFHAENEKIRMANVSNPFKKSFFWQKKRKRSGDQPQSYDLAGKKKAGRFTR